MKRKLSISLILVLTIFIGYYLYHKQRPVPIEDVFPGKIWAKPIETLSDVKGVGAPTAKNCGTCHVEIYEEWKLSTHANALSDIQFQSELAKPTSPKWICLNCHIPIQNQRETIITGLRGGDYFEPIQIPNPQFQKDMQEEAITCATCHVRMDHDSNESYVIGATGGTSPPHPIKINREFLQNRCNDCHNEMYTLNQSLVCSFQTGTELQSTQSKDTCVTCHLPEVSRSFVKPSLHRPIRKSHKHGFIGGGVPKQFSLYKEQIRLGYKSGLVLSDIKQDKNKMEIRFLNKNANHHVTTGDPERFYSLNIKGFDISGKTIYNSEVKIGQEWEWYPEAKKTKDNRISSGGEYIWKLDLTSVSETIVTFQIQAIHVRLKGITSDYMSKTADQVPYPYRDKVKQIKQFYPHSSIVLETIYEPKRNLRRDTPLKELFKRNENRRGE
ncbi:MAG: multiheme c-type cytochrome [Leptospira bouyouniensis]